MRAVKGGRALHLKYMTMWIEAKSAPYASFTFRDNASNSRIIASIRAKCLSNLLFFFVVVLRIFVVSLGIRLLFQQTHPKLNVTSNIKYKQREGKCVYRQHDSNFITIHSKLLDINFKFSSLVFEMHAGHHTQDEHPKQKWQILNERSDRLILMSFFFFLSMCGQ